MSVKFEFFLKRLRDIHSKLPFTKHIFVALCNNATMLILYVNQLRNIKTSGLITESFARLLQSPQKCAKHYREHLLFFKWIELRIVIYWEIVAEMKFFSEIKPYLDMYIFFDN